MKKRASFAVSLLFLSICTNYHAAAVENELGYISDLNYAQVTYVEAIQGKDGSWCIHTTVHHNDEGWDHYASVWEVLDENNNEIAWRLLVHPHDDEQPFTRSKCGINISQKVKKIRVRAKCKIHGYGGREVEVDLSMPEGNGYKVTRIREKGDKYNWP